MARYDKAGTKARSDPGLFFLGLEMTVRELIAALSKMPPDFTAMIEADCMKDGEYICTVMRQIREVCIRDKNDSVVNVSD